MNDEARTVATADWGERTGAALVDLAIAAFVLVAGVVASVVYAPPGGSSGLVDALWPLFRRSRNRAVHDMVTETHVIKLET